MTYALAFIAGIFLINIINSIDDYDYEKEIYDAGYHDGYQDGFVDSQHGIKRKF